MQEIDNIRCIIYVNNVVLFYGNKTTAKRIYTKVKEKYDKEELVRSKSI